MKQMVLFDDYGPVLTIEEDISMTWLELYNFLHNMANDVKNPREDFWNKKVLTHNAETGDEYLCDIWEIPHNQEQRMVLAFNYDVSN